MHADGGRRKRPWPRRRAGGAGAADLHAQEGSGGRCEPTLTVSSDAPATEPYWHREGEAGRYTFDDDAPFGLPYRPTPFYAQVTLAFAGGDEVISGLPVQYRYEGHLQRREAVRPAGRAGAVGARVAGDCHSACVCQSVRRSPSGARGRPLASGGAGRLRRAAALRGSRAGSARSAAPRRPRPTQREIRVTVVNDAKAAAEGVVKLELPQGWSVGTGRPAGRVLARRRIADGALPGASRADAPSGEYPIRASATAARPDVHARVSGDRVPAHQAAAHLSTRPRRRLKIIDVRTAPNLTVGYIMGVGDEVPAAIAQLGVKVEMISPEDLAWGDLSRFHTIVTGVRAYERRADLRANNSRLLDYVRDWRHARSSSTTSSSSTRRSTARYPAKVSVGSRDRRVRAGRRARSRPIRFSTRRTRSPTRPGRAGCRSAVCISSASATRGTAISWRSKIRSPTTRARSAARWSRPQYGKGRWVYVGPGPLARAPGRCRRRVSAAGESDQSGQWSIRDHARSDMFRLQIADLLQTSALQNVPTASLKSQIVQISNLQFNLQSAT